MARSNKIGTKEKNLLDTSAREIEDRLRQLTWLVEFAQETTDPNDVAGTRQLHQHLGGYLGDVLIRHADAQGESRLRRLGDPHTPDELPMSNEDHNKRLDEKLALIRAEIRRTLNTYLALPDQPLQFEGEIAIRRRLESYREGDARVVLREQKVADDVRHGIRFQLLSDLSMFRALVRRCEGKGCTKIFIRRYRREFCSTACRNRTNFGKWYQRTRNKGKKPSPPASKSAGGTNVLAVQTGLPAKKKRRGRKKV
jgi:hypothetical protein